MMEYSCHIVLSNRNKKVLIHTRMQSISETPCQREEWMEGAEPEAAFTRRGSESARHRSEQTSGAGTVWTRAQATSGGTGMCVQTRLTALMCVFTAPRYKNISQKIDAMGTSWEESRKDPLRSQGLVRPSCSHTRITHIHQSRSIKEERYLFTLLGHFSGLMSNS